MKSRLRGLTLLAIITALSACAAPGTIRHAGSLDPEPLLKILESRRPLADGLTATVHMDFEDEGRHFKGKAYLLVSHPGRFRLEVPGWMGSTILLMASDGRVIWAYYPEDRKAFRTSSDGLSLSPYLPFPFPIDTAAFPYLLAGTLPEERIGPVSAYEIESGGAVLYLGNPDGTSLRYRFKRDRRAEGSLYLFETTAESAEGRYTTTFNDRTPYLPRRFAFSSVSATLRARLESSRFISKPGDDPFRSPVPQGIDVLDLETDN